MSVFTGATTVCAGYPGWFSYDLPSASVGTAWTATLLVAVATGKAVTISGNGTCDAYGLEIVNSISAYP